MQRVAIFGNVGAGKSTLAMQLHSLTKLPIYHIDKILWREGWERVPEEEFTQQHTAILAKQQWILDGVGYQSTWGQRCTAADTIVLLDPSVEICKAQALKRMEEDSVRPNPFVSKGCPYPLKFKDQQMEIVEKLQEQLRPLFLQLIEKYTTTKKIYQLQHGTEEFIREIAETV